MNSDSATFFDDVLVTTETATSVADNQTTPESFRLWQNYPNPFNPSTNIVFELDKSAEIVVEAFNLAGQNVVTFEHGFKLAGRHQITWDAAGFPSGAYVLRLRAGGQILTRRMMCC